MANSHTSEDTPTIHSEMTIESILSLFPNKAQKLAYEITRAGLHCVGCHAATWETLEAGMKGHGKTEAEIEELVARLNALLAEETDMETISLTPAAASKLKLILAAEGKTDYGLRFGLKAAGCSGFEYLLDFSEKATENDEIFTSEDLQIHVSKNLVPKLIGSEIDYIDGLQGSGFKITNPNAKSSCGCGTSHGY